MPEFFEIFQYPISEMVRMEELMNFPGGKHGKRETWAASQECECASHCALPAKKAT